jgi:hypothetical protein
MYGDLHHQDPNTPKRVPRLCRIAALWQPASHYRVPVMQRNHSTIATLTETIARSPIVVVRPHVRLPAGYAEVDVAVLEWIAAEGRRVGRGFPLM